MTPTRSQIQNHAKGFATTLENAQLGKKPVQAARARERVLADFLVSLADLCGAAIEKPTGIDARGDIQVFGKKKAGSQAVAPYGKALAEVLSLVPRRTGLTSTTSPLMAGSGWCHINHFDVERLLKGLANGSLLDKLEIR